MTPHFEKTFYIWNYFNFQGKINENDHIRNNLFSESQNLEKFLKISVLFSIIAIIIIINIPCTRKKVPLEVACLINQFVILICSEKA